MSLEKYFKIELGKDVTSDVKDISSIGESKNIMRKLSFRKVYLPFFDINYIVPINDKGEFFEDNNVFFSYNNIRQNYVKGKKGKLYSFPENEKFWLYFLHDKNFNLIGISINKKEEEKSEQARIAINLNKKNENITSSSDISIFRNCIELFAKTDSVGKINEIKADYSEFAAWGADVFGSIKNPYEGIIIEHYKRKQSEKWEGIGEVIGFGDIKLDETSAKFVLNKEIGMKDNSRINYEATIDNFLKDKNSPWEQLLVFNK